MLAFNHTSKAWESRLPHLSQPVTTSQISTPIHGHILWVHGLNVAPQSLYPIALQCAQRGFYPHILHLPGHGIATLPRNTETKDRRKQSFNTAVQATPQWYIESFEAACLAVQASAQKQGLPYFVIAHSIGALVALTCLASTQPNHLPIPKKLGLLAPALWPKSWTQLAQYIPWRALPIPSLAPKDTRNASFVPAAAYLDLWTLVKEAHQRLQHPTAQALHTLPLLWMLNPEDELVDYQKTQSWFTQHQKTHWQWETISTHRYPHHALTDPNSFTDAGWNKCIETLTYFLQDGHTQYNSGAIAG